MRTLTHDQHHVRRSAEWVLPGHPDKLADAVADAIVQVARHRSPRALVGVEVALHRDTVFIDGRVACEGADEIAFDRIVQNVYRTAGYRSWTKPDPAALKVIADLDLGPLVDGEAEFREVSDDQSIVTGYACSTPGTHGLPIEHLAARNLTLTLWRLMFNAPRLGLGPDGKLIVVGTEHRDDGSFVFQRVSISVQHASDWNPVRVRRGITLHVRNALEQLARRVPGCLVAEDLSIEINTCGDFVVGGPHGDNGLSGKKLVVDGYGPRVPIGGGALSGKDFWKADRAGALIARELAQCAVQRLGLQECLVKLIILPGARRFEVLEATGRSANEPVIVTADVEALPVDRSLASMSTWPEGRNLIDVARWGHFAPFGSTSKRRLNTAAATVRSCARVVIPPARSRARNASSMVLTV